MNSRIAGIPTSRRCAALMVLAWGMIGFSCSQQTKENPATQDLRQVISAYEKATRYADSGEVHVSMKMAEGKFKEVEHFPFSVTFERPNKLRLHARGISVVSDGKLLRATVPGRAGQVLQVPAPGELTYTNLFNDSVLDQSIRKLVGLPMVPLRLLLTNDPLGISADDARPPTLLEDRELDGTRCQRIETEDESGKTVYWIDPETHVVRRVDFPTDQIKQHLPDRFDDIELWADFTGAQLNEPIAAHAFEFEPPQNALLLKQFIPEQPAPPPGWLGVRMPPFSFTNLEGKAVSRESLAGKIVVLDLWATWCGWCKKGFPNMEKVYERYKKNPKVAFLAVSTDSADTPNSDLKKVFTEGNWHVPIVRDTEDVAKKILGIRGLPTLVILGPDGTIQEMEAGFNENLHEQLPKALDILLAGGNFAVTATEVFKKRQKDYDDQLREAFVGKIETHEIARAKIAEASEPKALRLKKLWTAEDISHPGNMLLLDGDGAAKLVVLDGDRTVAELDADGKVVARHELEIPKTNAVNYLRTAVDKNGRRYFLAFAVGQQQFHLFDSDWKRLISFPDSEHAGLGDVQFADLDGDGTIAIYVGYLGDVGVQRVSLEGERIQSNRDLQNVFHLAVTAPDKEGKRALLCTSSSGNLLVLDGKLERLRDINVPDHGLGSIVAADVNEKSGLELCGLSATAEGKTTAIGFQADGDDLQEIWTYNLPNGVHDTPIETIVSAQLHGKDSLEWLLPGADGSIHILGSAGDLIDTFNCGAPLTGLAAGTLADNRVLLVASTKGLTAWKIEPDKETPATESSPEPETVPAAASDDPATPDTEESK